jgi:sugar lactone lactonase YvrE
MSEPASAETERLRKNLAVVVLLAFSAVSLATAFCSRKPAGETKTAGASSTPAPYTPPPFVPVSAKLDSSGRLWVLDSMNSRLSYSADGSSSREGWGGVGGGNTEFRNPEGLAVSGEDVYVADTWNHRISHFTRGGEWKGSASGFMGPRGVATGKDGSVWVADTGNGRVVKYDAALQNRRVIGGPGTEPGEFRGPVGIAVGPSGTVYVADTGNTRIQAFDGEGKLLRSWNVPWFKKTWMVNLEVGPDETIYASNPDAGEIVTFSSTGSPGKSWKVDDAGLNLLRPTGLGIDSKNGILYGADSAAYRVFKIKLAGTGAR